MVSPAHDDDTDYSDLDEEPQPTRNNTAGQLPSAKNRERLSERRISDRRVSERTPLIDNDPPPPAYAEVTRNDPPAVTRNIHGIGSQSDNNVAGSNPQSMGDQYKDPEGNNQSWKKRPFLLKKKLLALLALALVAAIIACSIVGPKHSNNEGSDNEKGKRPPSTSFPHSATCAYDHVGDQETFGYAEPLTFSMIEVTDAENVPSGRINGQIRVVRANEAQDSAIWVKFQVAKSSAMTGLHLYIDNHEGGFTMRTPHIPNSRANACMDIDIEINIKPGFTLENFEIATEHLDIIIEPGLFPSKEDFYIANTTNIVAVNGKVTSAYWASRRETRIDLTTGSVSGRFALRDLLAIKTRTGSINVEVDPKPIDPNARRPAEFTASSQSGSVEAVFPAHGTIPEREYLTRIDTASGSVRGHYILGAETDVRTGSGSIDLVVMPYNAGASSWLRTETTVGRTSVTLLSPYNFPETAIDHLRSTHKTRSGSIDLIYPQEWSGIVEAATLVGSLNLSGKDLDELKRWHGPAGAHVVAEKGHGKSNLDVSTTTGSIKAVIGDTV